MERNNENVIEKSKEINNKKPVIINIFKKEINIDTKEGQINLATKGGKINASNYQKEIVKNPKIIIISENKNEKSTKTSCLGDEMFGISIFIAIILTSFYSNYRFQVQVGLVLAALIIESATLFTYHNSKKAKLIYGQNIKEILQFNLISIFSIPILIGIINTPLFMSKINLDLFNQSVVKKGIIMTLLNTDYFYYVLFQMGGMLLLVIFLLYIVLSDIYIIALTNIVIDRKGKCIWRFLFKKLYKKGENWKKHVKNGLILLVISILCVLGIIPYIIVTLVNKNKVKLENF